MLILLALGNHSSCFIEALVLIMLPWLPLTEATKEARYGFLIAAFEDSPELSWKLLIQLLPYSKTSTYNPYKPKFMEKANIPEKGVATVDYLDEIGKLVSLACNNALCNADRVIDLIPFMDVVTENCREEIISIIKDSCDKFSEDEKYKVWLSIDDFIREQIKYVEKPRHLNEEQLSPIKLLSQSYSIEIWLPEERRLFGNNQWKLIDASNYDASRKEIMLKRDAAALRIYSLGINAVFEFISKIEDSKLFGSHLANTDVTEEFWQTILIIISDRDALYYEFAVGFIQSAYLRHTEYLQDYLLRSDPENAIRVYELLPVSEESIMCSEKVNESFREHYWTNVDVFGVSSSNDISLDYVVNKLIGVNRGKEVIGIVFGSAVVQGKMVKPELIASVLECCSVEDTKRTLDYEISQLVKIVQDSGIDENTKLTIEWKYLRLLTEEQETFPKTIYSLFANNPNEFIKVFKRIYGENLEGNKVSFDSDIYKLLYSWNIVPGSREDGSFDGNVLSDWIDSVQKTADENNLRDSVDSYIGRLLFYTPSDNDGFFINRFAAKALHSDIKGYMRNGYLIETFNSRGAHLVDETGAEEFELEKKYKQRAVLAENEGYTRFADTLRMIAQQFHDEAIYNIEEAKEWRRLDE